MITLDLSQKKGCSIVLKFKNIEMLKEDISYKCDNKKVWLITPSKADSEIIVTKDFKVVLNTFSSAPFKNEPSFYLMAFESFEKAYKVALDMREPYELCY